MASARGDISQHEFGLHLAKLKLLNEYFENDEKWLRFYSKFCVVD